MSLIANFPENYDASFFKGMKINFFNAPIERKISIKNDLKALAALYKIFKNNKFDSVHSVTPKAGLLTAMAAWLAGVKVRIHIYTGQVWATRKGAMRMMLIMRQSMVKRMMINSMIKTVTELTKVAISTVYLQRNKV